MASITQSLSKAASSFTRSTPIALPATQLTGIVVSAGRMQRAVKVRTTKQKYDTFLRRHYREHPCHLVSDPTESLRVGDVVKIAPWRTSKLIHHVVTELVVPFGGDKVDDRPAMMSLEELRERKQRKWEGKQERRRARRREEQERKMGKRGLVRAQVEVEKESRLNTTGKLEDERTEALRLEEKAEEIATEQAQQGVDLNKRMDGIRL